MAPISLHRTYIQFVKSVLGAYYGWYHHFRVEGVEYIPAHGPLFVTINHISLLDPFALGIAVVGAGIIPGTDIWTVAKKELFSTPLSARFFKSIGFFPIDREKTDMAAMRTMMTLLKQEKMIAIAPEGTRSPTGQLQLFQPVVAKIAISRRIPILPAAVFGAEKAMPVGSKFPRPVPVTLRFGPVYELAEFYHLELTEEEANRASSVMRAHLAELLPEWMRELPPPTDRIGARKP